MLITLRKKAQSTAEYVMLFAIVLGAVAMARSYLSKAIAGGIQYKARELSSAVTGSPDTLYDSTLDKKNTSKSARQSNERQHQDSKLDENHAYSENSNADVENASIGGDLQEAVDASDAYKIAPNAWDKKGSNVATP